MLIQNLNRSFVANYEIMCSFSKVQFIFQHKCCPQLIRPKKMLDEKGNKTSWT